MCSKMIFLANISNEQNIAFGVPQKIINNDLVRLCAKKRILKNLWEILKIAIKPKLDNGA